MSSYVQTKALFFVVMCTTFADCFTVGADTELQRNCKFSCVFSACSSSCLPVCLGLLLFFACSSSCLPACLLLFLPAWLSHIYRFYIVVSVGLLSQTVCPELPAGAGV